MMNCCARLYEDRLLASCCSLGLFERSCLIVFGNRVLTHQGHACSFSATVLFTLTCALISSAAVTVEREAGLFVIRLFSWCMPMDDKLDCRISRVKAAKFPQIQIKIFQQRTRRCVRARSSRPASTFTSTAGYRRAHFVRICLDLWTLTRLAGLLGIELPLHRPPSATNRSCTDAISGDANGKADSIPHSGDGRYQRCDAHHVRRASVWRTITSNTNSFHEDPSPFPSVRIMSGYGMAACGAKRPFQTSAASDAGVLRDRNDLELLTGCTCYIHNSFAHQKPCHWDTKEIEPALGLLRPLPRYEISVRAHRRA